MRRLQITQFTFRVPNQLKEQIFKDSIQLAFDGQKQTASQKEDDRGAPDMMQCGYILFKYGQTEQN